MASITNVCLLALVVASLSSVSLAQANIISVNEDSAEDGVQGGQRQVKILGLGGLIFHLFAAAASKLQYTTGGYTTDYRIRGAKLYPLGICGRLPDLKKRKIYDVMGRMTEGRRQALVTGLNGMDAYRTYGSNAVAFLSRTARDKDYRPLLRDAYEFSSKYQEGPDLFAQMFKIVKFKKALLYNFVLMFKAKPYTTFPSRGYVTAFPDLCKYKEGITLLKSIRKLTLAKKTKLFNIFVRSARYSYGPPSLGLLASLCRDRKGAAVVESVYQMPIEYGIAGQEAAGYMADVQPNLPNLPLAVDNIVAAEKTQEAQTPGADQLDLEPATGNAEEIEQEIIDA